MAQSSASSEHLPYEAALDAFLAQHTAGSGGQRAAVARLFHAVRNLTYASSSSRSPHDALRSGRGACTAKHLLLRDLLRRFGETADICMVEGDFAAAVPVHSSMPHALKNWAAHGGIRDFHNFVIWAAPESDTRLDATWPDALGSYGFALNDGWAGAGDTALALTPVSDPVRAEDIVPLKETMLARMSAREISDRREFLDLLTDWIENLPPADRAENKNAKPQKAAIEKDRHLEEGL